jgi:hypothetical protein
MGYLDEIKFQYYPADIKECVAVGDLSIREFIESHRNPKKGVLETFKLISTAAAMGDLKLKNELKKGLFYFTPSVWVNGWRNYTNIDYFTGLIQLDFDGITNAAELRDELFDKLSCVVCAYLSPSRLGCKMLVRVPVCNSIDELKSYIYGLYSFLEKFKGFDPAPKNVILPLYLSHDPDIKWREEPQIWSKKGIQVNEFDTSTIDPDFQADESLGREGILGVSRHIKNTINLADKMQVGHSHVVAASLISGGYCAQYMNINQDRMFEYLLNCIDESEYLQKDLKSYKITAKTMFNRGLTKPMKYEKK